MSTVYTQTYSVEREISMPGMEDTDWQEIELRVEYKRTRYYASTGPSWSSPGEPAEGGEVYDVIAYTIDGDRLELTDDEMDRCVQWLHDHHEE